MRSFVSRPIVSWGMLALAAVVAVATGVDLIASAQSSTTRQLSNLIQNGSFETPKAWTFEVTGGAQGSFTYDRSTKEDGTYSARVSVFASTLTVPWNVQLHQDGIPLHAGTPLTLSFWAKGSTGTARLPISLQQDVAPHTVYFSRTISFSTSWRQFMFDFTPTRTDSRSLLDFNYAGQVASVWIDHVVLNDSVTATGGTSAPRPEERLPLQRTERLPPRPGGRPPQPRREEPPSPLPRCGQSVMTGPLSPQKAPY